LEDHGIGNGGQGIIIQIKDAQLGESIESLGIQIADAILAQIQLLDLQERSKGALVKFRDLVTTQIQKE